MEKIVNTYNIQLGNHGYGTVAKIELQKGAKIISAKLDRWAITLFVLEDSDTRITKEKREIVVTNTGFKIPVRGELGYLERVLEHVVTIDIAGEFLHIFENTKR